MMSRRPVTLALIALLLPAASFLVIGVLPPLRRLGRPAAWFSIALRRRRIRAPRSARVAGIQPAAREPMRAVWPWLPSAHGPFADRRRARRRARRRSMLLLVTLVALLVQVYSLGYLHDEPAPALGRYYAYQSLFAFSMMGLVLAPNLLQLFICWELVGVCSYLLIGFWYSKPEAARAALKAFWITKAGDVGLLIGIVLLWRATGTFDLVELRHAGRDRTRFRSRASSIITFCIYLGAMGKSAQFPLHVWLPDAMEGPTPVSALIHAATMVTAGVYLLTRTDWLFALTPNVLAIVAWIGAFTALLAAVLACVQTDIKRVLAYSTVSQLGYMMAAIGAGFAARRLPPPADARRLQGAAVPRRRRGHPRRRQQRPRRHGRPRAQDAADGDRLHRSARCRSPASRSSRGFALEGRRFSARCGPAASPCRSSCCCSPRS